MPGEPEKIFFEAGEVICRQGESAQCMYVLRSGSVRVMLARPEDTALPTDGLLAASRLVATIEKPNALFGEAGAFLKHRSASVVAAEPTAAEVIPIRDGAIEKMIRSHPDLGLALARSLASRLRDTNYGLRLINNYVDGIQSDVERHCREFYEICQEIWGKLQTGAPDALQAAYRRALESASYLKGQELARHSDETMALVEGMAAGQRGAVLTVEPGQFVCRERDLGEELYVVLGGELEIVVDGRRVDLVGEGEMVGEIAVLLGEHQRRTADIRAVAPSRLCVVPAGKLPGLVERHPFLIIHINRRLAGRLENTNRIICDFDRLVQERIRRLCGPAGSCAEDIKLLREGIAGSGELFAGQVARLSAAVDAIGEECRVHADDVARADGLATQGRSFRQLKARLDRVGVERSLEALFADLAMSRPVPFRRIEEIGGAVRSMLGAQGVCEAAVAQTRSLAGHSLNVAILGLELASTVGIKGGLLEELAVGALLHDVGMLRAEREADEDIAKHPVDYAAQMLSGIREGRLPQGARDVIYQHHEMVDGSGYPNHLSGGRIGLLSRIAGLVNCYDLLRAKGLPPAKAIAVMDEQQSKFDPNLLRIFSRLIGEAG